MVEDNKTGQILNKGSDDLFIVDVPDIDSSNIENKILDLIFSEYVVIDKLKNHTMKQLDVLKEFLLKYEDIIRCIKIIDDGSMAIHKFQDFLIQEKEKIIKIIEEDNTDQEEVDELNNILDRTREVYYKLIKGNVEN